MTWTLIFCTPNLSSPQSFVVEGDPEVQARRIRAENEWMDDHFLVAAIEGKPLVRMINDAHHLQECSLT